MNCVQAEKIEQKESLLRANPEIEFDDFTKIELRIGKVLEAVPVTNSKKLVRLVVDFGSEKRQAVAGLMQHYKPENLLGKKFLFLLNIRRRIMAGLESQCMILAAEDSDGTVTVLIPEKDVAEGSKVG